jgi:Ni/Co efflux regulator RcnB
MEADRAGAVNTGTMPAASSKWGQLAVISLTGRDFLRSVLKFHSCNIDCRDWQSRTKEMPMRKMIVLSLMAAVAFPAAASAQSQREIRRDRAEVREQQQELRDARARGDRRDIREERRDVRGARQELREDRQDRRRSQYVSPYRDWRYTTVQPGYQLRSGFYTSRYYVNPVQYRLNAAGRNRQWIRYGTDLLLVNVRNGRVLQVLRNRYW